MDTEYYAKMSSIHDKELEKLKEENTEMKNIISKYYALVEEMLMFKKRDTEKSSKNYGKGRKIHKGVKL